MRARAFAAAVTAAVVGLSASSTASAHDDTSKVVGTGVIRYHGHGAEFWHWRAMVLAKRLRRIESRLTRGTGVDYALRLAAAAFPNVPLSELRAVARCESGFDPWNVNASSQASGLFQFLPSTWSGAWGGQSFHRLGFSVFDPIANALAAAQTVTRDGSWRQWVCKP